MALHGEDLVQHFRAHGAEAEALLQSYGALRDRVTGSSEQVARELEAAVFELAAAYLPSLDAAAVARAEKLTGFRGFSRRDPQQAMAHERHVLERTIARIEAAETWQRREFLVGPTGDRTLELKEAHKMLAPWAEACAQFEDLPGFLDLVRLGYDTPHFSESWWESSYWTHWAQGDAVCKALGLDDFGDDVLPKYQEAAKQRLFWQRETERLQLAVNEVHKLVQDRDQAEARIPQLPSIYLEQSQRVLGKHLELADLPLLDEWQEREPTEDRGIRMGLRRVAGMRAKSRFMAELVSDGIDPLMHKLAERRRKYARKSNKFGRRKHVFSVHPASNLDTKFEAKALKLRNRRGKLAKLVDRLEGYSDYDRFDLGNDEDLWWREFTGSRPPRMLPRTREWYDRNPQARPAHERWGADEEAGAAVAQALVSREDEDVYLS